MGVSGRVGGAFRIERVAESVGESLLEELRLKSSSRLKTRAKRVKGEVGRDEERWKLEATENGKSPGGAKPGRFRGQ